MLQTNNNPWLGLSSYQESDAKLFFGRDEEISSLCDIIEDNDCTVLYGKSGMGKTSLINAGLNPALSNLGYLPVTLKLQHNSDYSYADQIIEQTLELLDKHQCSIEKMWSTDASLSDASKLWLFFHSNIFWTSKQHRIVPVIFLDQFEEIFTLCKKKTDARDFFTLLNELFQPLPPEELINILEETGKRLRFEEDTNFRLILSVREDFLARLEDYSRNIPILRKSKVGIAPLNGNQALEVILKPNPKIIDRSAALKIIASITNDEVIDDSQYLDIIEIDTCVLSLFCSQLYKKASEYNADTICADLIENNSRDIIEEYYNESICKISHGAVHYLEEKLLTANGYRNSLAYDDSLFQYIKKEEIHLLEKDRIIRKERKHEVEFIEFTHDILCEAALKHKDTQQRTDIRHEIRRTLVLYIPETIIWACTILFFTYNIHEILPTNWNFSRWSSAISALLCVLLPIIRLTTIFVTKIKSNVYIGFVILLSLIIAYSVSGGFTNISFYNKYGYICFFVNMLYLYFWLGVTCSLERKEVSFKDMVRYIILSVKRSLSPSGRTLTIRVARTSFKMVYVEGKKFYMGATDEQKNEASNREYPVHCISLSDYAIAQTQVTQELWQAVMRNNPSINIGDSHRPVENVNWYDCQKFIAKLNKLTGKKFRLPTEAEWEYAARGGRLSKGYKYSGSNNSDEVAWHETNSNGSSQPVALKKPNELGLYDMSGNVWEWCSDFYDEYSSTPQKDPQGPSTGERKVMRGGSYFSSTDFGRVSNRFAPPSPLFKAHPLGFRLVMEIDK